MEMSYCSALHLQENSLFFDYDLLLEKSPACDPSSDPGYVSAGSSLSPTSSVETFCFSPVSLQALGKEQHALNCFLFSSTLEPQPSQQSETVLSSRPSSSATVPMKKSRSKYPSKKRQTASEREKLRMRDLTKALHHLRTYLPPSMAPAGQLTKIETLRLAIRYISYLSEQLGLRQGVLEQRRSSGFVEPAQTLSQFLDQPTAMSTEQLSSLHHSYQDLSAGYFASEESWNHHEQSKALAFSGQN
ncbi:mesoderm posterior protein 1-like [Poecilia latipinna]|uniref:Mesoderm posterior ab n=1 Tax=Poecilia formosa TaxID=48698 RepID=A0A087YDA6_POEFO|nr:PREDICTED: mesoderm posterior protein 1-like [Poecilia formosa]XP_014891872.1 PREDICTED: mesoderm posterior protein 1-like [Poecilia latipinna]